MRPTGRSGSAKTVTRVTEPDDPRLVLIGVDIEAASFLEASKPQPVVLYEVAKSLLTGDRAELGEAKHIET